MDKIMALFFCLMVVLSLARPASLCHGRGAPLHLTEYLENNRVAQARELSKVDRSCVEDFVPESYAGFMTTDKLFGNHLFFWFFPCTKNIKAPLMLWLNGGPTVSSMIGLFWEHGPMSVVVGGDGRSGYTRRQHSWAEHFSMLYVDNPVGVGFSYSNTHDQIYLVSQKQYTNDLASLLRQFFVLFPEFKSNDFYLGGQSYAGKYVSALGYHIHSEIRSGSCDVNLKGIFLGAPFYDPQSQSAAHYDYLYALGVISHMQLQESKREVEKLFSIAALNTGDIATSNLTRFIFRFNEFGSLDNYVTRQRVRYEDVAKLLGDLRLKIAAHVEGVEFVESDHNLYEAFGLDWIISTKFELGQLLNNYKVLIYNGDYDVVVNSPMIEAALLTTNWNHKDQYNNATRHQWSRGTEVIGFHSLTNRLCRVVVHGSGHQVPHDTPEAALLMMKQFVQDGCVSDVESGGASGAYSSSIAHSPYVFNSVLVAFSLSSLSILLSVVIR